MEIEYWILDENNSPILKTIYLDIAIELLSKYAYKENWILCSATPYNDENNNNIIKYDVETIGYFSIDNYDNNLKPNYYDGINNLILLCKRHKADIDYIEEQKIITLFSLDDNDEE